VVASYPHSAITQNMGPPAVPCSRPSSALPIDIELLADPDTRTIAPSQAAQSRPASTIPRDVDTLLFRYGHSRMEWNHYPGATLVQGQNQPPNMGQDPHSSLLPTQNQRPHLDYTRDRPNLSVPWVSIELPNTTPGVDGLVDPYKNPGVGRLPDPYMNAGPHGLPDPPPANAYMAPSAQFPGSEPVLLNTGGRPPFPQQGHTIVPNPHPSQEDSEPGGSVVKQEPDESDPGWLLNSGMSRIINPGSTSREHERKAQI